MQTTLPRWATSILATVGLVLVAGMFVDWIDLHGEIELSGWRLAWDANRWLLLVPAAGAALTAAASMRSRHTRAIAIATGALVVGEVLYQLTKGLLHADLATWLVLGGAGVVLAGGRKDGRALRVGGGLAVLVGFFAPWSRQSLYALLTDDLARALVDHLGLAVRMLWLIPIAGLVAIAAGVVPDRHGRALAIGGGAIVFVAFLWLLGSAANLVLGWGAWAALGASVIALVLGLIAPGAKPAAVAAKG